MGTILDLLQRIRERPAIILGRPSANTLYSFLSGYAYARKQSDPGDQDFLAGFNHWVHERFEVTTTQGWAKIIEFYIPSNFRRNKNTVNQKPGQVIEFVQQPKKSA